MSGIMKPRALDLFCSAGGATRGLQRAGFHVTGVDIEPQPRYCGNAFFQTDAMTFPLEGFDFIWASPLCQGYSRLRHLPWLKGRKWPLYIEPLREQLKQQPALWTIENVEDAPLNGFVLCGQMFGLAVYRHRLFETSFPCIAPLSHRPHLHIIGKGRRLNDRKRGSLNAGSSKGSWGGGGIVTVAGNQFKKTDGERAMGIDWMTKPELAQAIPPAYSEFIGRQAMQILNGEAQRAVRA